MNPSDNAALEWARQQLHEDDTPSPGEPVRDVAVAIPDVLWLDTIGPDVPIVAAVWQPSGLQTPETPEARLLYRYVGAGLPDGPIEGWERYDGPTVPTDPPNALTDGGETAPSAAEIEASHEAPLEREIPDVAQGTFCDVFQGPYAGRYGVYSDTASRFPDGTPDTVIVQTRDADDLRIVVNYADIKPAESGRR